MKASLPAVAAFASCNYQANYQLAKNKKKDNLKNLQELSIIKQKKEEKEFVATKVLFKCNYKGKRRNLTILQSKIV